MQGDQVNERLIWQQLIQGQEQALNWLFETYADALYRYGYSICPDPAVLEDLLQDLFFNLWKKRKQLAQVKGPKAYLFQSFRYAIFNHLTYQKRFQHQLPDAASYTTPESDWVAKEMAYLQHQQLHQAVLSLPTRMQEALMLRFFEGLTYEEISQVMDIQPQAAMNTVSRAIARLKQQLLASNTTTGTLGIISLLIKWAY